MREENTPSVYFNFEHSNQVWWISKYRKLTKSVLIKSTFLFSTHALIKFKKASTNIQNLQIHINFNLRLHHPISGKRFVRIYMTQLKIMTKVHTDVLIKLKSYQTSLKILELSLIPKNSLNNLIKILSLILETRLQKMI